MSRACNPLVPGRQNQHSIAALAWGRRCQRHTGRIGATVYGFVGVGPNSGDGPFSRRRTRHQWQLGQPGGSSHHVAGMV